VARAVHPLDDKEEPDPELTELYRKLYEKFTRLYPALKGAGAFD